MSDRLECGCQQYAEAIDESRLFRLCKEHKKELQTKFIEKPTKKSNKKDKEE